MCGIVGFIGREEAAPILLDGLARLEYRGYDSAGIAVYGAKEGLQVVKAKGRLRVLDDIVAGGKTIHGHMGLGHTRWATHGEPSDVNSHPHVSEDGRIAVVHNGIIENYVEIKEFLQAQGVHFASETDTEVVAQLLEYYYKDGQDDLLGAVVKVLHRIQGAYAFGIICADRPDELIAARKDSPLILGYGKGFHFLASDVTAVIKYTREVSYLDDGDIAVLTADGIQVYDALLQPVEKERCHVDWEISAAEKGGYEHFMAKEIMEQPKAFRDTVFPRIQDGRVVLDDLSLTPDYLREVDKLYIIACGSSYHVGMTAKYTLERLLRKPVEVTLASEFRYCDPIVTDKTLALVISQGAYNSEVIRAALGSIPKGQFEACKALGLNKLQTMTQIIIPQAALVAVPALANSFISLLKDTSLVSSITVAEILMTAKSIIAVKFQPLLLYCEAAFVYLIFSTVLTQLQGMLEKKLGKHLVDTRA